MYLPSIFFVKSERKYFKVNYADILFIEGLKDYVILQLPEQRIITRMNMKGISELLPQDLFLRVNKSAISSIPGLIHLITMTT